MAGLTAGTLVTGGAGFIGGELVRSLVADGDRVTVIDDLSTAREPRLRDPALAGAQLIVADIRDRPALRRALHGCRRVIHLASSTDLAGGATHAGADFGRIVEATQVVCEEAAAAGIDTFWFASSGVVYGRAVRRPSDETAGPLIPESHYAAGKLAAEAIVSAFAHLAGWRALVYRFGNTVGGASDHGLVHDLVVKLLRSPERIEVLGDGSQRKPFIHVSDLVAGMRAAAGTHDGPLTILNVATRGALSVRRVVELVIEEVGEPGVTDVVYAGAAPGGGGWAGDTPVVEFETERIERLGWRPALEAEEAVRAAARETAEQYRRHDLPLVTSLERNARRWERRPAAARDGSAA